MTHAFVQPDSIVPDPLNPQSLNRYSYVLNNPVRYSDPSGHAGCVGKNWDDGPQCFINGKPKNIPIPDWDPAFSKYVSEDDKQAAVRAYVDFLSDPLAFRDYYLNSKNAPLDYYALEVFTEYTTLHTTADQIILDRMASIYGIDAVSDLQKARQRVIEDSLSRQSKTIGGLAAGAIITRALTPEDLGIEGNVYLLKGTITIEDGVATVNIDMLAGEIDNPFTLMTNLAETAKAEGADTLRIQATVANERLYNILQNRYDLVSAGGVDYIEVPLTGGRR